MIDDKYLEMIHHAAEGKLGENQRIELERYLAEHEDARRMYDELVALRESLNRLGTVTPPAEIKEQVMRRVDGPGGDTVIHRIGGMFRDHLRFGYTLTFAGGLAAGIACFVFFGDQMDTFSPSHDTNLTGSMFFDSERANPALIDASSFMLESASGSYEVARVGEQIRLGVQCAGDGENIFTIKLDDQTLRLIGVERLTVTPLEFTVHDGEIRIVTSGRSGFVVALSFEYQITTEVQIEVVNGDDRWESVVPINVN